MNDPARPLDEELERAAADGFQFVDLTFEPPGAWPVDGAAVGRRLAELGLEGVGHTAPYLPFASPYPALRAAARDLFEEALDAFAAAGVRLVNLHPDTGRRQIPAEETRARNAEAVAALAATAGRRGLRVMVENMPRRYADAEDLRPLLEAAPEAALHLDVGHAAIGTGGSLARLDGLLAAFAGRVAHVHVHDNLGGGQDLHLPLGAGVIDWPEAARRLRAAGYDGTVTLEVFAREREHRRSSRRLWDGWWAAAAPAPAAG
jgi:sugar phosphate isomerase/epimerase